MRENHKRPLVHGRVHHVATVERDLDAAVRFHREILGLPLGAEQQPQGGLHKLGHGAPLPRRFGLCAPDGVGPSPSMDMTPVEPGKVFDNLYYIGAKYLGAFALTTKDGIFLIDTMNSTDDVKNTIEPGFKKLGLKMEDIKYSSTAIKATKGQAVTINLTNAGALDHDFTIEKIDAKATVDGKDAKTHKFAVQSVVKAKGNSKLEITPNAAGTFEFYCTVPGHKDAGMKGTLTVK